MFGLDLFHSVASEFGIDENDNRYNIKSKLWSKFTTGIEAL